MVDVQNDFLPGGALPVAAGKEVIAPLNRWGARFASAGLPVHASRDWHPPGHCSFRAQGGPWPPHCVAGTPGVAFAPELALPPDAVIVSKGTSADAEAYSAFAGTPLAGLLRTQGVRRLFVGGLATDYCVLHTVQDALAQGFAVVLLAEAERPVDARPGDGEAAIQPMGARGATTSDGNARGPE